MLCSCGFNLHFPVTKVVGWPFAFLLWRNVYLALIFFFHFY